MIEMTEMFESIYNAPYWFFAALGGLLLISELLGTGGYGLWSGMSAFAVAIIAVIVPHSWAFLWLLFAILTAVTAYFWWRWLNKHQPANNKPLNQPKKALIGLITVAATDIKNGRGRVKINDGTWLAISHDEINQGDKVEVIDVDGITLTVKKILI